MGVKIKEKRERLLAVCRGGDQKGGLDFELGRKEKEWNFSPGRRRDLDE